MRERERENERGKTHHMQWCVYVSGEERKRWRCVYMCDGGSGKLILSRVRYGGGTLCMVVTATGWCVCVCVCVPSE